jgi:hypothetical protein
MWFCICISPICDRERGGIRRANKSHFQQSMCILRTSATTICSLCQAEGRSKAEQGANVRRRSHRRRRRHRGREREGADRERGRRTRRRRRRHQWQLRSRAA